MRAATVAVGAAVVAVVAVGMGVAVAADGDDVEQVDAVSVGDVTVDDAATASPTSSASPTSTGSPSVTSTGAGPAAPQQVPGLDQVQGVLTRDDSDDDRDDDRDDSSDDDFDDFEVAGVDLELGPESWLLTAGPVADFDGDGTARPVLDELEALLGQEVTVAGRYDDGDDDDLDVYEINGLTFRDSAGAAAPWQGSGAAGDALARDEVVAIALDAVGADSRLDSVDREDDGGAAWEVEVVDAYGQEQRVLLDAAGTVLDIRPED